MSTTQHIYIEANFIQPRVLPYKHRDTSKKDWVQDFRPITFILHPALQVSFDNVFGEFWPDDDHRWEVEGTEPSEQVEFLRSEADVARLFCKQISGVVMPLWGDSPQVRELYECKPARMIGEDSDFTGKVDASFMIEGPQMTFYDPAIVEFKAPGVIDVENWLSGNLSSGDNRLARELRRYAYNYRCAQIACFDGLTMLVIRFRAVDNYQDIKTCDADLFVLNSLTYASGVTLRYAMYRLIADGVRRVMATLAPKVNISGWECRREWYSGKPYWVHPTQPTVRHETLANITRHYDDANHKRWYWQNGGVFAAWCSSTHF